MPRPVLPTTFKPVQFPASLDIPQDWRRKQRFLVAAEFNGIIFRKGAAANYLLTSDAVGNASWTNPSSSPPPVVLTNYWYKPGISATFTAYMGLSSGQSGTLSSTAHATKGKILFGASSAYDEAQTLWGIGTASPAATIHLVGSASGGSTTLLPSGDINNGFTPNLAGTTTVGVVSGWTVYSGAGVQQEPPAYTAINLDDGDTRYIGNEASASGGANPQACNLSATAPTGKGTWTINYAARWLSSPGAASGRVMKFRLVLSDGKYYQSPLITVDDGTVTTSWQSFSTTIDTSSGGVTAGTSNSIETFGPSSTVYFLVGFVSATYSAGANIARWDEFGGTQRGRITRDGYVESRQFLALGSTSGTITITGGTSPTSHTYILPTAQGAASTFLQNDGAGQLSWTTVTIDSARTWSTLQKFKDTTILIGDDGDITKALVFSLGGATAAKMLTLISSHTLDRSVTFPNATTTLAGLAVAQTFTAAQIIAPTSGTALTLTPPSGTFAALASSPTDTAFPATGTGALTAGIWTLAPTLSNSGSLITGSAVAFAITPSFANLIDCTCVGVNMTLDVSSHDAGDTASAINGLRFAVSTSGSASGAAWSSLTGASGNVTHSNADPLSTMQGVGATLTLGGSGGTVTTARGFNVGTTVTTGTITTWNGFRAANPTGTGTITTAIGLRIESITKGTTNYAIDSAGGQSRHVGNLFIGAATNPTAKLHLAAGTTAASTAPIKLTTGTSMTSAEAGAVEFTTDDLFFTITTGTARKRILFADATGGLTSGKIPIATTNGRLVDLTASSAYTPTNVTTDRSYDANATTLDEVADVLGTLIADLQAKGILG